ncbi:MAG: NfeD family protein [Oscillospiraceae bacterium]|nr:NfeD family protein [Oscillospiraceae bacterium]
MPFTIDSTYIWLAFAAGLAILEIVTPTIVCLWFIAGSVCAFLVSFLTDSIMAQVVVFAIATGLCLVFTRPLARKMLGRKPVPTNVDMLIGKHCIVTEDILPDKKGRVKADGVFWRARSDTSMKAGETAEILAIAGATLTVAPLTVKNI